MRLTCVADSPCVSPQPDDNPWAFVAAGVDNVDVGEGVYISSGRAVVGCLAGSVLLLIA